MTILVKLKRKFHIESNWDLWMVLLVFSLAGIGVSISRKYIFGLFGINHSPLWLKILFSILLIIPLYQASTLFFGFLLGQFHFFWARQKNMVHYIARIPKRIFQPRQ